MTRIAFVSDLHTDSSLANWQFVARLKEALDSLHPDVFIIGGDISAKLEQFDLTLAQFSALDCVKIVIPGNHDIWIESRKAMLSGYDSGAKFFQHLPGIASKHGFVFLHDEPVILGNIAIAGCMGWYDYSYRNRDLDTPDSLKNYARGKWTKPSTGEVFQWNDMQYVWWLKAAHEAATTLDRAGLCRSDAEIASLLAQGLRAQLSQTATETISQVVIATHFVPSRKLLTYRGTARDYWNAYQGSESIELAIRSCAKVKLVLFGHRHEDTDCIIDGIRYLSQPVGYLTDAPAGTEALNRICLIDL